MTSPLRRPVRSRAAAVAALLLAVPLVGCTADSDDAQPSTPAVDSPAPTADGSATPEAPADGDPAPDARTGAEVGAENETVATAIELAEATAGGTAFEVERTDAAGDRVWEVSVAVDGAEIEVLVSLDGAQVLGSRPDGALSPDERAALDAATVTIAEAISTALAEVEGVLDEVDLERHGDGYAWEVGIDHGDGQDTDVYVDVASGEVLAVG